MKALNNYVLLFMLICAFDYGLYAQPEPLLKNLGLVAESEKYAYQRLTQPHESLILNNYDLKYHRFFLFADPAQAYISGSVTSYYVAEQNNMSSIQFELYSTMSADSAFHRGKKAALSHNGNLLTISFNQNISKGMLDSVSVYYHGNPTASGFGSFGTEIHNGAPGMWTLSEPYGASDWWPSKNDLTDKIDSVDMFVVTPRGNHVAGNGVLVSEASYGSNSILAHWKHRYPIVSYLIAIASTNYARFSDYYITGSDSLEVLNYVYPEDSAFLMFGASTVLPSLALFEKLFGSYPFRAEKYGHAQFGWGGGMEHQTMTFLGKNAFNAEVIAHELAHQWFGDMITCGSWHDIWLNEGFATYSAGLRYEFIEPKYWYQWRSNQIKSVCKYPDGSVYCQDTTDVGRVFSSRLSYSKGAMLLHMLRWVIGDDNFFKGIKNYATDPALQHGFARSADFKAHMEAVSGRDLTGFFANWLYGEGYPSYSVNVEPLAAYNLAVTINQRQSHSSVGFFDMPVPIRFYGQGRDTLIVFNHTFSGQKFFANPGFAIDSMKFDPELRLVSANNSVLMALPAGKTLSLMPNPSSGYLYVQHDIDGINSIEIITMDGKAEQAQVAERQKYMLKINTLALKSGMYFLRIAYNGGISTQKFIIKR